MTTFKKVEQPNYMIVHFVIANQISPSDLPILVPPDSVRENFAHKGVILSGKGPVWLYGFLIHYYHPTKFIATYDPRLQGAVVVESHGSEYKVGDIISIDASLFNFEE